MRSKRSGEWVSRTPATKIKELMSTYLETILATDSVQHAAGRMRAFEIGCLLVRDQEELVGMITDRDIALRVTALGKNARTTAVSEVMSPGITYYWRVVAKNSSSSTTSPTWSFTTLAASGFTPIST